MGEWEIVLRAKATDFDGYQELLNFAKSAGWKRWGKITLIDYFISTPKKEL